MDPVLPTRLAPLLLAVASLPFVVVHCGSASDDTPPLASDDAGPDTTIDGQVVCGAAGQGTSEVRGPRVETRSVYASAG
jgi:hypothetical protein